MKEVEIRYQSLKNLKKNALINIPLIRRLLAMQDRSKLKRRKSFSTQILKRTAMMLMIINNSKKQILLIS